MFSPLQCPECGGSYLHHDEVKVFCRPEDASTVIETTVSDRGCTVYETDGEHNPSDRRGGISIQFWCEHCPALPVLQIAQHKGESLVSWQNRRGQ